MATAATTAHGGCLCGGIRYEAEVAGDVSVCHCDMCRRWTGGPMMAVHPAAPLLFREDGTLVWYRSSEWAERGFCSRCGAALFYRLADNPSDVTVGAGSFDEPSVFTDLVREIFIDEKPEFYAFAGSRPHMTGAAAIALFTGEAEAQREDGDAA